jgi:uncharacterized membrane protein
VTPRTSKRFLALVTVLAIAGIVVAGILTASHLSPAADVKFCSSAGGCQTVADSEYSSIGPVPVAVIGLAGYLAILAVVLLATQREDMARMAPVLVFGMSLIGVLFSAWMTYLELFVIHAICPWCVTSAAIITAIFVVSVFEVRRARKAAVSA